MKNTDSNETIKILKTVSLFKDIKKTEDLKKIATVLSHKHAKKGDFVIKEGDEGDTLYIMKEGSVQILKRTLENEEYTIVNLASTKNMCFFFGELALLDNDKRSATIIANTDCDFYILKRKDFETLGDKQPTIGLKITREISKILAGRLRKANADIITLFEALVSEVSEGSLE